MDVFLIQPQVGNLGTGTEVTPFADNAVTHVIIVWNLGAIHYYRVLHFYGGTDMAIIADCSRRTDIAVWPDIGIFMAYTQRDELQNGNPGHDFLSGGISLNIPLYSGAKQSKKVEESQYSKNMISERYSEILNQVYFDLENTRSSVRKNARLVELFRHEIIPQARQSVESALVGYQTDKIDFLTLINNQITLFNYDLDYYRVLTDYNKDLARLEFLTGVQFTID